MLVDSSVTVQDAANAIIQTTAGFAGLQGLAADAMNAKKRDQFTSDQENRFDAIAYAATTLAGT